MSHTELNIKEVAHLARLALTSEEEQAIGAQLEGILDYFAKLREVDVSGVEPTAHAMPVTNVTRPDETRSSLPTAEVLRNAPRSGNDLFMAPKIVE